MGRVRMNANSQHRKHSFFIRPGRSLSLTADLTISVLLFILLTGCITPLPQSGDTKSGTYIKKLPITVMGAQRSYLVHVPQDHQNTGPLPLVVVIHGAFSTAKEIETQSGFSELADKEKFIVVYPNGAFGILGFLQHWNAGHCCGRAAAENIDDIGFLDAVIADAAERFNIDRHRIYMAGHSNGGMLAYRYAAERSETVAAIATAAASIGGRASEDDPVWVIPLPERPVPLIVFHGKEDRNVPYRGGRSPEKGGTREYFSVEKSVDFWVLHNRCGEVPLSDTLYNGLISRQIWRDKNKNNSVVLFSLEEWGHMWPGKYFTGNLDADNPLKGFDAAEIIWQFLRSHTRE
jgi:polyhydroxybutyrate depolymerase